MQYKYDTVGTCSQQIIVDVEGDMIKKVEFIGGCSGNTQGVARLA
ncbi:MAG: TSCPD domain-containing protein, partial [Oscillospiraceae bacterium]|nr:TSCPD domain-containing protein [Oscillospiraceae bacterium]